MRWILCSIANFYDNDMMNFDNNVGKGASRVAADGSARQAGRKDTTRGGAVAYSNALKKFSFYINSASSCIFHSTWPDPMDYECSARMSSDYGCAWTMDYGLWTMDYGLWTDPVDCGL